VAAQLRAADAATWRYSAGWTVVDATVATQQIGPPHSPWQVAATNAADHLRWFDPIDIVYHAGLGVRPPAGATISVSQRHDSVRDLPGWWTRYSAAWSSAGDNLVRIYVSIAPTGLSQFVTAITSHLDETLPFALKCPLDPERCMRPDGVVLYLPGAAWPATRHALRAVQQTIEPLLRDTAPALTCQLARGFSLAESPDTPDQATSFGSHRCQLIARGIWPVVGTHAPQRIVAAALDALSTAGLRSDAPWLNPGSAAVYDWPDP
jgi:hypothetical protein